MAVDAHQTYQITPVKSYRVSLRFSLRVPRESLSTERGTEVTWHESLVSFANDTISESIIYLGNNIQCENTEHEHIGNGPFLQ